MTGHPAAVAAAPSQAWRRTRVAVTFAYASQGLGYAVVVNSLPALKAGQHLDDTTVSVLVLGVCVSAAVGSLMANSVAVRWGSRAALIPGLFLQAIALPIVALPTPFPVFTGGFVIYGIGLGCVDAATAMQGVTIQRAYGRPLLGGLFAAYTAAAITGGLLVSAFAASTVVAGAALLTAAAIALIVAITGVRLFAREIPINRALPDSARAALPRAAIWAFGLVILAAFTVDSSVSTWSSVYLNSDMTLPLTLAPIGYVLYQVVVLATRLATDRVLPLIGRRRLIMIATTLTLAGLAVIVLLPFAVAALAGFALSGVAVGVLVPVMFGAAGDIDPDHADHVIARVNTFSYAGAVLGAVMVGLFADGPGLRSGFLVPAVALAVSLFIIHTFRSLRHLTATGPAREGA